MHKTFKIFLAIYIPVFVACGVIFRNNNEILYPLGYTFSAITLIVIGWLLYQMKFKKK